MTCPECGGGLQVHTDGRAAELRPRVTAAGNFIRSRRVVVQVRTARPCRFAACVECEFVHEF